MDPARFTRDALSAGTSPEMSPLKIASRATNPSDCQSIPASDNRGVSAPSADFNTARNRNVKASPNPPPASANTTLSVKSWRNIRPRDAPSETRSAISLERATDRESNRLATLAQAISSTKPTAHNSNISLRRTSCTRSSCNVRTVASAFQVGAIVYENCLMARTMRGRNSFRAWKMFAPGRNLPMAGMKPFPHLPHG